MNPQELGRRVSKKRKDLELSQEVLAERAGISRNYLSIIERGDANNISMDVLNRIAAALETTSTEILGEKGQGDILIPPTLREFGVKEGLSFEVVDKLARIPRRGQEPKTVEEWRKLYRVIKQYLEEG